MEYIAKQDYEYITNKYHDVSLPAKNVMFNRFIRREGIFSESTGIDGDAIKDGILKQDETLCSLPHQIRKAKAFEYVLKNTRISCDARDRFPAICSIDRPLNATVIQKWKDEVFGKKIPEVEAKRAQLEKDGIVTIWPDYDHSVPNWDRVFEYGFNGLLKESETARSRHTLTEEQEAFFEGIKITYTAIIDFIGRLADLAKQTEGSQRMANALSHIRYNAPSTFYEALLVDYIYFILSEHIEGLQVRSLCNFDRLFYPFYKKDLENGISEQDIRIDLAYFFLQFTAIGNYWNQPVYLGGEASDGKTIINELSYIFLDVHDKMGIYSPKIQIKVSDSTPKEFLSKALDMIRRGHNSIVFVSDMTMRRALTAVGFTEDEARTCDITSCYEYAPREAFICGMNYLNLMKPLEYTLHKGYDGVTGAFSDLSSPELDAYTDFDTLFLEYKRQLKHVIDVAIATVNDFEDYLSYISPQAMISATFLSCLEKATDAMHGGSLDNDSLLLFGFIADIADSLAMIRKYVYEKKNLTLKELVDMLNSDFKGNEIWQRRLKADCDKYGNNKALPDEIAVDIASYATSCVVGRSNARNGKWNCGFHVARMSYEQGKQTASSPNGRLLGEELSKNISASMGQNKAGATAAILSATKIDASKFTSDAALDLGLHPSSVKGEDGLNAMHGLLNTFVKRGGHALHINVFDADTLRDAQAHPDKYQDLQIRVCGWNVLWNNINRKEQDGFIRQAEALI